jgi:hypothetical protein
MWTILGILVVMGGVIAYMNERKQDKKEKKEDYNLIDPKVDVEPLYNKKNN